MAERRYPNALTVYLTPTDKAKLEEAASKEHTTLSSVLVNYALAHLAQQENR